MNAATDITAQLSKLLPHWAEHCGEHVAEIAGWRGKAEGRANPALLVHLLEAEQRMALARDALVAACALLPGGHLPDGPGSHPHPHTHEHGDHDHDHPHPHRP